MKRLSLKINSSLAFSMIELMITVAVVSVCLVFVARGFTVSMMRMSVIKNEVYTASLLDETISELRIKAAKEEGLKKGPIDMIEEEGFGLSTKGNISQYTIFRKVIRNNESALMEIGTKNALVFIEANWPRGALTIKAVLPGKGMKEDSDIIEGRSL